MKRSFQLICLALAVLLTCTSCGLHTPSEKADRTIPIEDMKIGVLFPDNATATGTSHYHLLGIEKAVSALKIPTEPIYQKNITDTTFTETETLPKPVVTQEATEATTKEDKPETVTDDEGNVFVRPVPITPSKSLTAVEAMAELIDSGCNILIATDPIYNDFFAWVAKQYPDRIFLQYRGTHTDLPNLQSYSENLTEAFYLAGAAAGAVGSEHIGFVAGLRSEANRAYINAFALGVAETNEKSKVTVRFTGVPFDLVLERTVPEALIAKDKCDLIAQSVITALPQTVAANTDKTYDHEPVYCIGFGYDMVADGGKKSLCAVLYAFEAYFSEALTAVSDGTFTSESYVGGIKEGVVCLSGVRTEDSKILQTVSTLTQSLTDGTAMPKLPSKGYAQNVTIK